MANAICAFWTGLRAPKNRSNSFGFFESLGVVAETEAKHDGVGQRGVGLLVPEVEGFLVVGLGLFTRELLVPVRGLVVDRDGLVVAANFVDGLARERALVELVVGVEQDLTALDRLGDQTSRLEGLACLCDLGCHELLRRRRRRRILFWRHRRHRRLGWRCQRR